MQKTAIIVGIGVLLASTAAYAVTRKKSAPDGPYTDGGYTPSDTPVTPSQNQNTAAQWWDFGTNIEQLESETIINNQANMQQPTINTNMAAFLECIAQSEGTTNSSDPYRVCFGYKHSIANLSEHPKISGEWPGEPLSAAMCKGAGLNPGCVSTAAGKYQIIKPTWVSLRNKLALPDFGPASQDAAAIELIKQSSAYEFVQTGQFSRAVDRCKKVWASLPGAGYGQGERSMAWLQNRYTQAGGIIA